MSARLVVLALLALAGHVAADSVIQINSYGNSACTGDAISSVNRTAAACENSAAESNAFYFDASNVYYVQYAAQNCSALTIQAIIQIPKGAAGCGVLINAVSFTTDGPVSTLPWGSQTFPPASGYAVRTTYKNVTAEGAKNTACSVVPGVVSFKTAARTAYCVARSKDVPSFTQPSYEAFYCSADGTQGAELAFSDAACTVPRRADVTPIAGCTVQNDGTATTSDCTNADRLPEGDVDDYGFTTYDDALCLTPAKPTTTYLDAVPTSTTPCWDRQTLVCGVVNGTDGYATYQLFKGAEGQASGTCTGDVETQQVLAGTCVKFGTQWRKYTCQGPTPPGGDASMASVSIVATVVAAFAALVAGRSL